MTPPFITLELPLQSFLSLLHFNLLPQYTQHSERREAPNKMIAAKMDAILQCIFWRRYSPFSFSCLHNTHLRRLAAASLIFCKTFLRCFPPFSLCWWWWWRPTLTQIPYCRKSLTGTLRKKVHKTISRFVPSLKLKALSFLTIGSVGLWLWNKCGYSASLHSESCAEILFYFQIFYGICT